MDILTKVLPGEYPAIYITLVVLAAVIAALLTLIFKREKTLDGYSKTLNEHAVILTGMSKLIDMLVMQYGKRGK